MASIPPKMDPDDALKDGPPGYVVKAGLDGTPGWGVESAAGGTFYSHHQGSASAHWVIPHNLGFKPNVQVEDSAHTNIEGGAITHVDANNLTIDFSAPFSGDAFLS